MGRCAVILADLYPAASLEELPGAADVPRLPALEYWLSKADVTHEQPARIPGWYGWLARQWGVPGAARAPAACVAGALGIDAPAWLVTPLHYQASLDTMRLHHAGLLSLPLAEQQVLAADFARVFAGSGWHLRATGVRELLLTGPASEQVDVNPGGVDPARLLGGSLVTGQPQGEGAAVLRRLASEIELWLHEHPVNRQRRGSALAVSSLWPWGGGHPAPQPAAPAVVAAAELHGGDLFSVAVARQRGV